MDTVNAQIPLAFHPTQNIGPDFGKAIANAAQVMQVQQAQEEITRQNALRGILGAPGAINPMGMPTPEALSKVMGVDPAAGMKLSQNALVTQQHQMQQDVLKSKLFENKLNMLTEAYGPIGQRHDELIKGGMAPQQADAAVQKELDAANQQFSTSGLFTPEELSRQPKQYSAPEFQRFMDGSQIVRDKRKELLQQEHERRTATDADKRDARSGMATAKDSDGNLIILRPNAPPAERVTYPDGRPVPPEKQQVSRLGTGAGVKIEDVQVDGVRTQAVQQGDHWVDKDGNRITGNVARMGKLSGTDVLGLTPETLNDEAEYYNQTGVLKAGYSRADRQAIQNRAAELRKAAVGGGTTGDRIASGATIKADTGSLGTLTKQSDAISAYEKGADREFDLAQSLIPKTPEPFNMQLLTKWVRSGEKQFGDVPNAKFYTALTSALDEYAKVIGGGYGAAASTDSARNLALTMIPPGATTAQIKGVIETIKQGMEIKRQGYKDQIDDIKDRLRGTGQRPAAKEGTPTKEGAGPRAAEFPPPPPRAIEMLKADPATAPQFDGIFGPGAAERIMKGGAPAAPATPAPMAQPTPNPANPAKPTTRPAPAVAPTRQLSRPTTQAEFDAVPSGGLYVNPADGQTYRKNATP